MKSVSAWARGERSEIISNNINMKPLSSSYIWKDVNKKYPSKRRLLKPVHIVSRENLAHRRQSFKKSKKITDRKRSLLLILFKKQVDSI
jgi:hypothetical protein